MCSLRWHALATARHCPPSPCCSVGTDVAMCKFEAPLRKPLSLRHLLVMPQEVLNSQEPSRVTESRRESNGRRGFRWSSDVPGAVHVPNLSCLVFMEGALTDHRSLQSPPAALRWGRAALVSPLKATEGCELPALLCWSGPLCALCPEPLPELTGLRQKKSPGNR